MLPIHTILYPTDFSKCAEQAFPLACSLARDLGARIVALYVVPPPIGQDRLLMRDKPEEYYESPRNALHSLRAPDENVRIEHKIADGDAATEILRCADDIGAGLIVIGTHGRSGVSRLLLGSVAEHVIRHGNCPVLAIKNGMVDGGEGPILLPTDLSPASETALGIAFSLARDYRSRLIVLHVADSSPCAADFEAAIKKSDAYQRELGTSQSRLAPVAQTFLATVGDAASEIQRIAASEQCRLVVMGTHGRSGLARILMGSVVERTLREATCPLLLVKHHSA